MGLIAPRPTVGLRDGRLLTANRSYVCPARPSSSPIGASLVLKGCFRWGDPTQLPTPRQRPTSRGCAHHVHTQLARTLHTEYTYPRSARTLPTQHARHTSAMVVAGPTP